MEKTQFEESPANVEKEASAQVDRVVAALDSGLKPLQVLRQISSVLVPKYRPNWLTNWPTTQTSSTYGLSSRNKRAERPPVSLTPDQIEGLQRVSERSVDRQSSTFLQIEQMKAVLRAERSPFKALVLITLIIEPETVAQFLLSRAGVTVS